MDALSKARAARRKAWKAFQAPDGIDAKRETNLAYKRAALALRVEEWKATGGESGNVPRPTMGDL